MIGGRHTGGFHLSAKTAFGIGIQFDTTVDWGFDLKKAGFDFKASVQGDYVKVLTERMFAAFQSNPGLSDDEINEGGGFMKGLLSSTMEHMLEGVLDTRAASVDPRHAIKNTHRRV